MAPDVGRTLAVNPGYGRSPDPTQDHHMTELGALTATIGIEALDVSDQADAVLRALNDVVVHKGSGALAASFSGLSIYFPPSADLFSPYSWTSSPNTSGWADVPRRLLRRRQGIAATELPAFVNVEPRCSPVTPPDSTDRRHAGAWPRSRTCRAPRFATASSSTTAQRPTTATSQRHRRRRIRARQRLLRPHRPALHPTAPAGGPAGSRMVTSWWVWMGCATRRRRTLRGPGRRPSRTRPRSLPSWPCHAVELQPTSGAGEEDLIADLAPQRVQRRRTPVVDRAEEESERPRIRDHSQNGSSQGSP